MNAKSEEEGYADRLDAIYEGVVPAVSDVAKLVDDMPPSLEILYQAYSNHSSALQSLKAMESAPNRELQGMKKDLERTLTATSQAGQMALKMTDDYQHGAKMATRMHFASVVGFVGNAEGYHGEFLKKRSAFRARLDRLQAEEEKRRAANKVGFSWFVGQQMASALPYRRKGLLGRKGCEWAAVAPMSAGAFFVGCSLALADSAAAEDILSQAATTDAISGRGAEWRTAFSEQIGVQKQKLEGGQTQRTPQFDDVYPDLFLDKYRDLFVYAEECPTRVGQWVIPGLICGVSFPEPATAMLRSWVTQPRGWRDLKTGGLQVEAGPRTNDIQEAYRNAQALYEEWRRVG